MVNRKKPTYWSSGTYFGWCISSLQLHVYWDKDRSPLKRPRPARAGAQRNCAYKHTEWLRTCWIHPDSISCLSEVNGSSLGSQTYKKTSVRLYVSEWRWLQRTFWSWWKIFLNLSRWYLSTKKAQKCAIVMVMMGFWVTAGPLAVSSAFPWPPMCIFVSQTCSDTVSCQRKISHKANDSVHKWGWQRESCCKSQSSFVQVSSTCKYFPV